MKNKLRFLLKLSLSYLLKNNFMKLVLVVILVFFNFYAHGAEDKNVEINVNNHLDDGSSNAVSITCYPEKSKKAAA